MFVEWTQESRESGDKEETDNQVHKTTGRSSSYTGRLHGAAHKMQNHIVNMEIHYYLSLR